VFRGFLRAPCDWSPLLLLGLVLRLFPFLGLMCVLHIEAIAGSLFLCHGRVQLPQTEAAKGAELRGPHTFSLSRLMTIYIYVLHKSKRLGHCLRVTTVLNNCRRRQQRLLS
jgi:hypothetical protein